MAWTFYAAVTGADNNRIFNALRAHNLTHSCYYFRFLAEYNLQLKLCILQMVEVPWFFFRA